MVHWTRCPVSFDRRTLGVPSPAPGTTFKRHGTATISASARRQPITGVTVRLDSQLLDAGKRVSDTINSHLVLYRPWYLQNKWMAFRLADGTTDNVLYDSKRDAVRHQSDEFKCFYVSFRNCGAGCTPREAAIWLVMNRQAYDKGYRFVDPDHALGGASVLLTTPLRDYLQTEMMPWFHRVGI